MDVYFDFDDDFEDTELSEFEDLFVRLKESLTLKNANNYPKIGEFVELQFIENSFTQNIEKLPKKERETISNYINDNYFVVNSIVWGIQGSLNDVTIGLLSKSHY